MRYLFALLLFTACSGVPSREKEAFAKDSLPLDPEAQLELLENNAAKKQEIPLGILLGSISFEVNTGKTEAGEEGIIPWISLEAGATEIASLVDPHQTVLPYPQVELRIDYPLTYPAHIPLQSAKGFTRLALFRELTAAYTRIYKEESETAAEKVVPASERKQLLNRNKTNGRYGIWGHDLADLVLSGIDVYKTADGKIIAVPVVES